MLHLNKAMVHFQKELFVQLLWQFINNPWLILLDPDVIRKKKKSTSIFGSVCHPVMKYLTERERERRREGERGSTMLWFGLTGQSLSELPSGTQCGRFHDTKGKRSAEKCMKFIFPCPWFGETGITFWLNRFWSHLSRPAVGWASAAWDKLSFPGYFINEGILIWWHLKLAAGRKDCIFWVLSWFVGDWDHDLHIEKKIDLIKTS